MGYNPWKNQTAIVIDIKIYFLNVLIFIHWINHFITIDSDLHWNTLAPGIAGKCIFIFFHFQEGHNNDNKPVVRLPKEQVCLKFNKRYFLASQQKPIPKCKSVWQELICLVLVCCQSSIKCGVSSQRNLCHFFGS